MRIVGALDVHRRQITYKTLELESGELKRGRIAPAVRAEVRGWLAQFAGLEAHFALEGTTGWRFVVEEIERAGHTAHLERDGLSWPHRDGLIWPHPRPTAGRAFGLFGARAGGRRGDGIEGGAVRTDS